MPSHIKVCQKPLSPSVFTPLAVISYLTSDISKQGLLIIPGIVGQISQIFIGSALARYLAPKCALLTWSKALAVD